MKRDKGMLRPTIDPSLWPIPTVSESLWDALLNGAVSPEPYLPAMEHDLRNAVTKAYRLGLTDVAEFAQIELDRLLLAEELGPEGREEKQGQQLKVVGLILLPVGLLVTCLPFLMNFLFPFLTDPDVDFLPFACIVIASILAGSMLITTGLKLYLVSDKSDSL